MKIYAAIISYDHVGSSVMGVFETQEGAKQCCQDNQDKQFSESSEPLEWLTTLWLDGREGWIYASGLGEYAFHSYNVEEHEVAK